MTPARSLARLRAHLVCAIATTAAAVFALRDLGARSLWIDEGSSAYAVTGPFPAFAEWLGIEPQFALYHLILRGWTRLGSSEFMLRFPSALCTVAVVPVVFAIGRRLFGANAGAIAALLFAVNGYVLGYAQEARPYALVVMASSLATLALVRAVDQGSRDVGPWRTYAVAASLCVLSHPFGAAVVVAHGVALIAGRRDVPWRQLALSAVIPIALVALLAANLAALGGDRLDWIPPVEPGGILDSFKALAGRRDHRMLIAYLVAISILMGSLLRNGHRLAGDVWWSTLLAVCLVAAPVILTLVASMAQPLFLTRYVIVIVPPLVILVGAGLAQLPPPLAFAAVGGFVALALPTAASPIRDEPVEQWPRAVALVAASDASDDLVVVTLNGWPVFLYYQQRLSERPSGEPHPTVVTSRGYLRGDITVARPCLVPRVWLVVDSDRGDDGVAARLRTTHEQVEAWRLGNIRVSRFDRLATTQCAAAA